MVCNGFVVETISISVMISIVFCGGGFQQGCRGLDHTHAPEVAYTFSC